MKRLFIAAVVVALVPASWAYEPSTHEDMSENAVRASVLFKDAGVLAGLGIKDLKESFQNSKGDKADIIGLVRNGAHFEDDDTRPINHFFDPLRNQPLRLFGFIPLPNETSPDWALEDTKDIGSQAFSLKDARGYLYNALTSTSQKDRDYYWQCPT